MARQKSHSKVGLAAETLPFKLVSCKARRVLLLVSICAVFVVSYQFQCLAAASQLFANPQDQRAGAVSPASFELGRRKVAMSAMRVLHHNVFEDGLTDAPSAIGLKADFSRRLSALLEVLSDDGRGERVFGFGRVREFSQMPPVVPLKSGAAFFDVLDNVYTILYHPLGGEARFGTAAPGDAPDLRSSLRTLFLRSKPKDPAATDGSGWEVPDFEKEIAVASALAPEVGIGESVSERVRLIGQETFDAKLGQLAWKREHIRGIWKRTNNVFRDKWCKDLTIFLHPPADVSADALAALSRFCHVRRASEQCTAKAEGARPSGIGALIEVDLDEEDQVLEVRTRTLQASLLWMLQELCKHSLENPASIQALKDFLGQGVTHEDVPATAAGRAAMVFPRLLQEMEQWTEEAALQRRHTKVCATINDYAPALISVVEFDAVWRRSGLPEQYVTIAGKGSASLAFDGQLLERQELSLDGSPWPPLAIRSSKARGEGDNDRAPKSSCMILLRRRSDGVNILVATVHLDSAPPSDNVHVAIRADQLRATLGEISLAVRTLKETFSQECVVVLAGDFNALFEEFIHGNGDAFYATPGTMAVRPSLRRPVGSVVPPPDPVIARIMEDGQQRVVVNGVAGNELIEASALPGSLGGCSRAGTSMWIDFIFVGATSGLDVSTTMSRLATQEDEKEAACPEDGVKTAVSRWGSDHLPVACELAISIGST